VQTENGWLPEAYTLSIPKPNANESAIIKPNPETKDQKPYLCSKTFK
jgi:hypothetical protein